MSNLNSFVRSAAASYKRAERAQQRKAREASRKFKAQQLQQADLDAAEAIQAYNNYISILKSVHKEATDIINWEALLKEGAPTPPVHSKQNEEEATRRQFAYKPGFLDRLFKSEPKKRQKLEQRVVAARQKDATLYDQNLKKYQEETADYNKVQEIARGVLAKDITAYRDAIEFFEPFSDISELGTEVNLEFDSEHITLNLMVNDSEVIPNYVLSETKTGKLSKKNMPVSKFNELYQDYVCSCVLRIARETLAYLPVNYVVVNAIGDLFDSTTGHGGEETILSVVVSPEKLAKLNLESIDPSDSMKNFLHHMQFSKTKGFSPVTPVNGKALIH